MEPKHLTYFKVENFKRFDSLEVKDIGQFNLIVGDNNVGKTSLLEALLFDEENYNQFLRNIFSSLALVHSIKQNHISSKNYFDYNLKNVNEKQTFNFRYHFENINHLLTLSKKLRTKLSNTELEQLSGRLSLHNQTQHLIEFELDGKKELCFISFYLENDSIIYYYPFARFNFTFDGAMVELFSQITTSNSNYTELKLHLKSFIPNLTSIELNNAIVEGQTTIVIREQENEVIKPLTQYGDGVIKLFRYFLELDMCQNRRLMIDEIDTGIHYSRQKDFLKKVIQTAKNKKVQIFATTHSKECLQYFTQALKELDMQDEGRIIKIADTKSGIKAYSSRFEEFESSLWNENEIR